MKVVLSKLCAAALLAAVLSICVGCQDGQPRGGTSEGGGNMAGNENAGSKKAQLKVTSTAFGEGGAIPSQYTCDGRDGSPPLAWSGVPASAKTLALIADDPDAPRGTWVHWVLYNLPAAETSLAEGVPATESLPNGARQGRNDFGRAGYGGPCPPSGTHRYFFKLYALDAQIDLPSGATKDQLLRAMEGHVVAEGQLMGRYQRSR